MKTNYSVKKMMLKGIAICGFLMASVSSQAVSYGPNLVLNPGFEEDFTSWNKSAANTAIETNLERVISETKSLRLTSANANQWGNVNQVVTVVAGSTYRFKYTGRVLNAVGASGGIYEAPRTLIGEVRAGDTATGESLLILTIEQGADTTVSGEFTVPEGVTQVYIRIIKSHGICYADDVTLQLKDITSGLNSNAKNNSLQAFSNNDNSVTIQCEEPLKQLRLINIYGQTIFSTNNFTSNSSIPIIIAARGIYIVEGITENNTKVLTKFFNK